MNEEIKKYIDDRVSEEVLNYSCIMTENTKKYIDAKITEEALHYFCYFLIVIFIIGLCAIPKSWWK